MHVPGLINATFGGVAGLLQQHNLMEMAALRAISWVGCVVAGDVADPLADVAKAHPKVRSLH